MDHAAVPAYHWDLRAMCEYPRLTPLLMLCFAGYLDTVDREAVVKHISVEDRGQLKLCETSAP